MKPASWLIGTSFFALEKRISLRGSLVFRREMFYFRKKNTLFFVRRAFLSRKRHFSQPSQASAFVSMPHSRLLRASLGIPPRTETLSSRVATRATVSLLWGYNWSESIRIRLSLRCRYKPIRVLSRPRPLQDGTACWQGAEQSGRRASARRPTVTPDTHRPDGRQPWAASILISHGAQLRPWSFAAVVLAPGRTDAPQYAGPSKSARTSARASAADPVPWLRLSEGARRACAPRARACFEQDRCAEQAKGGTWPCGLMDKALVFGTKDYRFESCQGHLERQHRDWARDREKDQEAGAASQPP